MYVIACRWNRLGLCRYVLGLLGVLNVVMIYLGVWIMY